MEYFICGVDECAAREITSEEVSGYMSNRENQHTYIFSSSLCTHKANKS
jgi:hypothetical protein